MTSSPFQPELTADGSFTFYSLQFQEHFHSCSGAQEEALHKFVLPTGLDTLARSRSSLSILDICYGLGYNTAAALATILQANPHCRVHWIGLEWDRQVPIAALQAHLLDPWPDPIPALLAELVQTGSIDHPTFQGQLLWGDARQTLPRVYDRGFRADAIFLDPFSPPHCPELWTIEFLTWVGRCLSPEGRLATYSCAAAVRSALQSIGLTLASSQPIGRKNPGTIASFSAHSAQFLSALSLREQEHLRTRAAVPYRDPTLSDPSAVILQRRALEQQQSSLEPTTQWQRRWS